MKRIIILLIGFLTIVQLQAQNNGVAINTTGTSPDASAVLDVSSIEQGMLVPRMTMVQRDAITTPATSLMIYQTDNTPGFYYYDGTNWVTATGAKEINDLTDGISDNTKNVFLGTGVGVNSVASGFWNGQYNVGLGIEAFKQGVDISKSVAIGYKALYHNNTTRNTAIGYLALETVASGAGNTAIGPEALRRATGENNTALGQFGLTELVGGNSNTSIGTHGGAGLTAGKGNIFLGYGAGDTQASGDGNIAIGTSVQLANLTASNQMNIGNTIFATDMKTASAKLGIGNGNNAPNSTLSVKGSMSLPIITGTGSSDYTLTATDYTYVMNGTHHVTLPTASGIMGRIYIIKNIHASHHPKVSTTGSETIDGQSDHDLDHHGDYVKVQSDGANWIIIGQKD